ncbi:hypothetical protein TFLX_00709 [Thermoflexales bacterium]|nr:hypothetical protein TFLX_00709 [Thermoflexales bacterium]
MSTTLRSISTRLILIGLIALISMVAISLAAGGGTAPAAALSASPIGPLAQLAPAATGVITLTATDDARTQGGSPTTTFGSGFLYLSTLNGHRVYVQFDLLDLPISATINAAELRLNFTTVLTGPNGVNVGRAEDAWDEQTLTWSTQPSITWGTLTQTVSLNGLYSWDVTGVVQQWHTGALPNYGFGLRGSGGPLVAASSKETGRAPELIITYTVPTLIGARPDLGDAPDSTNHVGITNTAYPGVAGRFPTVWAGTPITQPAGPRHANQTGEGWLGDFLSRESEADTGPDEDGVNNILNGGANNANNDRGDDGWRNRMATFDHCEQTTLKIRVSKALTATLNKMYLNVWFDGTHDGDWNDHGPCLPEGEELQIPATEWIVQDYIVDLTGITPGGFADITLNTETVLNTSSYQAHWMRFMLSEARAVQSASNRADGRGPHPVNGSYQFGETEDALQRPQPPGEDGTLILEKQVLNAGTPVDYGGIVTYRIRLRHAGGSQPLQAEIRDELEFPQHVLPHIDNQGNVVYVDVSSPTGGAAPLQAKLKLAGGAFPSQLITWRGALAPDSEVMLDFDVHVHPLCGALQQTETIDNIARARPIGGSLITDTVSFIAKCPGYDEDNIEVAWGHVLTYTNVLTLTDYKGGGDNSGDSGTVGRILHNGHSFTVTLGLTHELSTNLPNSPTITFPKLQKVTLGPGVTRTLDYFIDFTDLVENELELTEDLTVVARQNFCILPGENVAACPDGQLFPQLVGHGAPLTITVSPHDLGDAPDSTNHAGAAMTAYPAVQANYPTVFDPALGQPIGPMHLHPRPFHLGQNVSREAEADGGPDEDPLNNIVPAANDPNNDRFDDGINPNVWALSHCQTRVIPVRVFISPQAVNWFQQQDIPAYLNLWLDGNRDGDWADGFNCPPEQAGVEHIVIDRAINVGALGAGVHTINVTTGLLPWPTALAQQPAWVRVTLSERPSNKTLNFGGINYGDGRGYGLPFHTGETEDYYAHPEGVVGAGPDMAVRLKGDATREVVQTGTAITATDHIRFKIDYANLGSRPASGAVLTLSLPAQLQGIPPTVLQAPGIPSGNIQRTHSQISFILPYIEQDNVHQIVLGWATFPSPLTALPYTMTASVHLNGDLDLSNNQATEAVRSVLPAPLVGARVGNADAWGLADSTCRTTVDFAGLGTPGQTVELLLDDQPIGNALIDSEGLFYFQLQNLGRGLHHVAARYSTGTNRSEIISPRDQASGQATGKLQVDPSLPIDPLSLTFTDSQGHILHPATLGWSFGESQTGLFLKNGETYQVGVESCSNEPNQRIQLIIAILIGLLRDDDGDGHYTGSFTYNPIAPAPALAAADELRFSVIAGGAEQSFGLQLEPLQPGIVRDALTQQPIVAASVAALGANLDGGGEVIFNAWPAAALGQPNPQATGADGAYRFNVPGVLNRLEVSRAGYQSYRSWDVAAENGLLAHDIDLTPALVDTAVYTITITDHGFEPAILKVAPGSIIAWVNVDLAEHTTRSAAWDSGTLNAGQAYRVPLTGPGTYTYVDDANPLETGVIVVESRQVYLPLIRH